MHSFIKKKDKKNDWSEELSHKFGTTPYQRGKVERGSEATQGLSDE